MREFICRGIWRDSGKPAIVTVSAVNREAAIAEANSRGIMVDIVTEVAPKQFKIDSLAFGKLFGAISLAIGALSYFVACSMDVAINDVYNTGLLAARQLIFEFGSVMIISGTLDLGFITVVETIKKGFQQQESKES